MISKKWPVLTDNSEWVVVFCNQLFLLLRWLVLLDSVWLKQQASRLLMLVGYAAFARCGPGCHSIQNSTNWQTAFVPAWRRLEERWGHIKQNKCDVTPTQAGKQCCLMLQCLYLFKINHSKIVTTITIAHNPKITFQIGYDAFPLIMYKNLFPDSVVLNPGVPQGLDWRPLCLLRYNSHKCRYKWGRHSILMFYFTAMLTVVHQHSVECTRCHHPTQAHHSCIVRCSDGI